MQSSPMLAALDTLALISLPQLSFSRRANQCNAVELAVRVSARAQLDECADHVSATTSRFNVASAALQNAPAFVFLMPSVQRMSEAYRSGVQYLADALIAAVVTAPLAKDAELEQL